MLNARQLLCDGPYLSQYLPLEEGPAMALPLWYKGTPVEVIQLCARGLTPFARSMLPDEAKLSSLHRAAAYSAITVHLTPRPMVCGGSDIARSGQATA